MVTLTSIGSTIQRELYVMCERYEELRILDHVVMPDHIHFVVFAERPTEYHLGTAIGSFKGSCFRGGSRSLFMRGFHDRILTKEGQLQVMRGYVIDNPRRLLIKRLYPNLFTHRVTILLNGEEFDALGNIFLLKEPLAEQIRVSSRFTADELAALDKRWKFTIQEGGVFVSPFISPAEKQYRNLAIENGGKLILIGENGLSERFKPGGRYFDLCAEGRLLIIAPKEQRMRRQAIRRSQALAMNELASHVAAGRFEVRLKPPH